MGGDSWTHMLSRPLVRPLIGTWVRPNHLTTLRLASGIAACAGIALGTPGGMGWGAGLWIVSAFLDRADGELARLGKLSSPGGHLYDTYADFACNALFFAASGIGLRGSWLGHWAIPLGLVTSVSILLASLFAAWIEDRSAAGVKAISGRWGFHPDDALYLMGPFIWLGWLAPILLASAICLPIIMLITAARLWRMARRGDAKLAATGS